jgi:hypothetical protein
VGTRRAERDLLVGRIACAEDASSEELFTSARLGQPNLRMLTAISQYSKPEQKINTI